MGYCSDVAIRIQCENEHDVDLLIEDLRKRLKVVNEDEYWLDDDQIKINDNVLTLSYFNVKWYTTSDNGVRVLDNWLDDIYECAENDDYEDEPKEQPIPNVHIEGFQFLRIGDDIEDIEEDYAGNLDNYLRVNRTIDFND